MQTDGHAISFCLSLDNHEWVAFHHALSRLYAYLLDSTSYFCFEVIVHLHGLEHHNSLVDVNVIAYAHLDIHDYTRQRSLNSI